VEQEPDYHPEGDVFTHTCHCCDALAKLPKYRRASEEIRTVLMLATLTHDFGKPSTTTRQVKHGRERITSYGHEEAGGAIAESFLKRIYTPPALIDRILPLVTNHMVHYGEVSPRSIRRLANRLRPETIETLVIVIEADQRGRPPKKAKLQNVRKLQQKARQMSLESQAPQPILQGRHLLELGLRAGPEMGTLLKEAFEAQLNGDFTDLEGALQWARRKSNLVEP
jgi:tRNA nucleotidyltransferase (CCA-adding enzyme)